MSGLFDIVASRRSARKQRLSLRRQLGEQNLAEAERAMQSAFAECGGDLVAARSQFRLWAEHRFSAAKSPAMVIALVQLAWTVYQILKHFGWLSPSPEQFSQAFLEDVGGNPDS